MRQKDTSDFCKNQQCLFDTYWGLSEARESQIQVNWQCGAMAKFALPPFPFAILSSSNERAGDWFTLSLGTSITCTNALGEKKNTFALKTHGNVHRSSFTGQ